MSIYITMCIYWKIRNITEVFNPSYITCGYKMGRCVFSRMQCKTEDNLWVKKTVDLDGHNILLTCTLDVVHFVITVQLEILAGIKFDGWAPNQHFKNISGFKFGGSVRDRHMYICKYEILADFNLVIARQTTKLPNFPAIQYSCYQYCIQHGQVLLWVICTPPSFPPLSCAIYSLQDQKQNEKMTNLEKAADTPEAMVHQILIVKKYCNVIGPNQGSK